MKYYISIFLLLIAPFFLSGIKQKINPNSITESKWSGTISNALGDGEDPELNIADIRVVEGSAGQRIAEVMVTMPHVKPNPVMAVFNTRNGTALAGSDYVRIVDSLTFAPGDVMKKIRIPINGDGAIEADETFQVALIYISGIELADSIGIVTIINDDFTGGNLPAGNISASNLSVYEVRFTYTGYTSFAGSPADCPIRPNGKVVLNGLLGGAEKVASDADINYSGTLQMDMDIDICSTKPGLSGDNAKNCGITVFGSGPVKTELKILFDGRGAYILTKNESRKFLKTVTGSCDQEQMDEEFTKVPNETIASVFNGTDLPMLTNRTLLVGRYVVSAAEGEWVVEVLRKVR
jgi:Calx-beta domain